MVLPIVAETGVVTEDLSVSGILEVGAGCLVVGAGCLVVGVDCLLGTSGTLEEKC